MAESDSVDLISQEDWLKVTSTLVQLLKFYAGHTRPDSAPTDPLKILLETKVCSDSTQETIRLKARGVFLKEEDKSKAFDPSWLHKILTESETRWNRTQTQIAEVWKSTDVEGLLRLINRFHLKISVEVDEEGTFFVWRWRVSYR